LDHNNQTVLGLLSIRDFGGTPYGFCVVTQSQLSLLGTGAKIWHGNGFTI